MMNAKQEFKDKYGPGFETDIRTGGDYEYIRLKDFDYSSAEIKEGTTIRLLSYSGTQGDEDGKIFYCQYIGVNQLTKDTVRY